MAEPEELSEDSLFDNAVEGVEEAPEPAAVEQPAPPEPEKTEEVSAQATPDEGDVEDDGSPVPSGRFRQAQEAKRLAQAERDILKLERDRLAFEQQEFRRRIAALEQPQQPKEVTEPDPLLDPRGYRDYMKQMVDERLLGERREMSLLNARERYTQEFDEAYAVAQKHVDPVLRARMQQSSNPGETLIGWYRELKVRAEVGNDVKAYREKVRAEFLEDTEFRKEAMAKWRNEAPSQVNGRPNVQLAPSMNGVSRSNAAIRASQVDLPDDDLWDQTTT